MGVTMQTKTWNHSTISNPENWSETWKNAIQNPLGICLIWGKEQVAFQDYCPCLEMIFKL